MNRRNTIPVYLQIASMLIRDIQARRYADGDRLPPERQLARELGTTVTTLRKSLRELENKGFLERVHGSGNYVRTQGTDDSLYSFFRLELADGGGLPRADLVDVVKMDLPEDVPQFGASNYGFRFRRRRFLNEIPIAVEEIWLDGACAEQIHFNEVLPSLYLFYRRKFGLWITRAEDRIGMARFPSWTEFDDHIEPDQPCGYIDRLSWSQDDAIVEYSKTWFSTERARYVARLK